MWANLARPAAHVLMGWTSCFLAHKKMDQPDLTRHNS